MTNAVGTEPNPLSPPVREFIDGTIVPYANLQEIRASMVQDDGTIIDAIADRLRTSCAEPFDHASSARILAVERAKQHHPDDLELPALINGLYQILAPESPLIPNCDFRIVEAVASRLRCAKWATVFKWNKSEGIAPAQQARNRLRAIELARLFRPEVSNLPTVVGLVYEFLVPATVAIQQEQFSRTRLLPEIWDLGY